MSKIINVCGKCRRAGQKLFLKGERCLSPKCPMVKRSYAPGQHGQNPQRLSEYARQLREKQKAASIYGISAKLFRKYYLGALKKKGMTDLTLLRFLEMRLDNLVFRLGFTDSRRQARVSICSGHILLNGKKVTSPSCQVKIKEIIEVKKSSQKKKPFSDKYEILKKVKVPNWLALNAVKFSGQVLRMPEIDEIDTSIDIRIILEYFAR